MHPLRTGKHETNLPATEAGKQARRVTSIPCICSGLKPLMFVMFCLLKHFMTHGPKAKLNNFVTNNELDLH